MSVIIASRGYLVDGVCYQFNEGSLNHKISMALYRLFLDEQKELCKAQEQVALRGCSPDEEALAIAEEEFQELKRRLVVVFKKYAIKIEG